MAATHPSSGLSLLKQEAQPPPSHLRHHLTHHHHLTFATSYLHPHIVRLCTGNPPPSHLRRAQK
ncbi:hypothetical protein HanHA300_Chr05g0165321 [Helianthus annuus]|nr:hypothetical protein HanHA300_Chr05g0165321 [Helianthus annuus]KAJ0583674.1 hypothetical protein HanHA89_Chr05g0179371 [Helianthus annuus]KAJ0749403.1 hypothetical protein HanLR1_Chr05g0169451 [Helianthus annuus]